MADEGKAPWWVWAFLLGGAAALGGAYAFLRSSTHLDWHADIGTALGPVAAFLSLFAVVAALWSVHVQRRELALQREELRETREEMKAQRAQFERTAKAQERLADMQSELASATRRANTLSEEAIKAQLQQVAATRSQQETALLLAMLDLGSARHARWKQSTSNSETTRRLITSFHDRELRLIRMVEEQLKLPEDARLSDLIKDGG